MAFEKVKQVKKLFKNKHLKNSKLSPFRHWAIAFVVCNFNVDLGPEIELVYPPDTRFSTADLSAICFNSFPETQNTETTSDLVFHFTIPNTSPDIPLISPCAPHGSATEMYGSCFFRQEYDHTTKRSFNQKTLVLVSNHNFPALFTKLVQLVVQTGFISDPPTLEAAVRQIETWTPPSVGRHELPFLGNVLEVDVAPHSSFALQGLAIPVRSELESKSEQAIYVYGPVGSWEKSLLRYLPSISDLYLIFEKLLLCESIIVLSKSPQICSEFVSAAIDLVRPVPYAGFIRPYLIMQSEFTSVGQDGGLPRNFVIGITNPFLLQRVLGTLEKSDRGMPHVVYLEDRGNDLIPIKTHGSHLPPGVDVPGTMSIHRPAPKRMKTDQVFAKSLIQMMSRRSSSGMIGDVDSFVRRHFAELSAQFVAPINRYLAAGMAAEILSPGGNPRYGNFSETDFLKSLSKYGTSLGFKGQNPLQRHKIRDTFYETFCRSPNFYSWLDMKLNLEKEASAGMLNSGG